MISTGFNKSKLGLDSWESANEYIFAQSSNVHIPYHFWYTCIKLKFCFQHFKLILIYIPSILTSVCRYHGLHFFWNMLPFLPVFPEADSYSLWELFLSSWGHLHHHLQESTPVPPLLWGLSRLPFQHLHGLPTARPLLYSVSSPLILLLHFLFFPEKFFLLTSH